MHHAVAHLIEIGYFGGDVQLPPSRALAKDLGVSRNTVNIAYEDLIVEGYLVSNPRSGIFVSRDVQKRFTTIGAPSVLPNTMWSSRVKKPLPLEAIERVENWETYPYPFVTGQVDVNMFPRLALLRSFRRSMQRNSMVGSLQDWFQEDDPYLVDMICRHVLPSRGIEASSSEVMITLGSQQGLHSLCDALIDGTSTVAVEDPGYIDARLIAQRAGASIKFLDVDELGVIPPKTLKGVDLLHVTPGHQHPTNVTLASERRYELLEKARQSGTVVVEDDYNSEFQYVGSPSPPLRALDLSGIVVYLGTFSKFLAPGLRSGYMVADRFLLDEVRRRRRFIYRHPPGLIQRAIAHMIESGDYGAHLRHYRKILQKRWATLNKAAERHLPWSVKPSRGGLCLWTEGPVRFDGESVRSEAHDRGVLFYRTDLHFSTEKRRANSLRLGFGAIDCNAIEPGMEILGRIIADALNCGK